MSDRVLRRTLPRFQFFPSWLDDLGLSANEMRIYCHLVRRAGNDGKCHPGTRSVARVCKMSPATVVSGMRELVRRGLVERRSQGSGKGFNYFLLDVPNGEDGVYQSRAQGVLKEVTGGVPIEGTEGDPIEGDPKKDPPKSPKGGWTPTKEQKRLNKLVRRRDSTRWDPKEIRKLKTLSLNEDDLQAVEGYYSAPSSSFEIDFRRKAISQILNNWAGEVDRAQAFARGEMAPRKKRTSQKVERALPPSDADDDGRSLDERMADLINSVEERK